MPMRDCPCATFVKSAAGHRRHDREWPDPGGRWRGCARGAGAAAGSVYRDRTAEQNARIVAESYASGETGAGLRATG
jgi:hypothetical protein